MPQKQIINAHGTVELVELTPAELAQMASDADAHDAQQSVLQAERVRLQTYRDSTDLQDIENRLRTATASQINTWIDTDVINIATARTVLKAIVKLLVKIANR